MQSKGKVILGIDTSLRGTGLGVAESVGSKFRFVESRRPKMPAKLRVSECLRQIHEGIIDVLDRCQPEAAAIEGSFFSKNAKTAMILGQARGVAIEACASKGIPVFEYAPKRVKQAVTGYGTADKHQVAKMVCSMLGIDGELSDDETDALALAICHVHNRTGYAELESQEI
jgi:crossover junction endodeoxyribonuclease RuvC